jgi:hypothetical protein
MLTRQQVEFQLRLLPRCPLLPVVALSILAVVISIGIQVDAVRNEDSGRSGPGLFDRITDIGENRESEMCFPSFLWVCATNNLGS